MCRSCREELHKIIDHSAERVEKVQLLKEKWAREKELKAKIYQEKKELELRKIRLECQQASIFHSRKLIPVDKGKRTGFQTDKGKAIMGRPV